MIAQPIALLLAGLSLTGAPGATPEAAGTSFERALDPNPELTIHRNAARRTLRIEYGPMDVPAGTEYGGELVTISIEVPVRVDGWLRSFDAVLVDPDGKPVPEPLLHHAGLFAPNRRDLFSPAMERVVAFGQETQAIRLPGQLGYRVQSGDTLLLLGALYNTDSVHHESVTLRIDMIYADARRDPAHTDVLPLYLDVMPPGNRVYEVPPGRSSRSWEWSPAIDGRILALGGHLHRYGQALILEDVTAGDTLWAGAASHDEEGQLLGVDRKIFASGKPIRADRVYRVTAIYDNPEDEVVRGAMGKIGGLFLPEDNRDAPPADPTDPAYIRDWQAMVEHTHEMDHVRAAEQRKRGGHH